MSEYESALSEPMMSDTESAASEPAMPDLEPVVIDVRQMRAMEQKHKSVVNKRWYFAVFAMLIVWSAMMFAADKVRDSDLPATNVGFSIAVVILVIVINATVIITAVRGHMNSFPSVMHGLNRATRETNVNAIEEGRAFTWKVNDERWDSFIACLGDEPLYGLAKGVILLILVFSVRDMRDHPDVFATLVTVAVSVGIITIFFRFIAFPNSGLFSRSSVKAHPEWNSIAICPVTGGVFFGVPCVQRPCKFVFRKSVSMLVAYEDHTAERKASLCGRCDRCVPSSVIRESVSLPAPDNVDELRAFLVNECGFVLEMESEVEARYTKVVN